METRTRWQDWVNLLLGLWLFFTPFFGFGMMTGAAALNGYIFGAIIVVLSIVALFQPQFWEEWINLFIGLWLIFAPFALGYAVGMFFMWNSVIVGLLVGGAAVWAMYARPTGPTHHVPHHA
jgi:hypothetical protein